MVFQVTSSAPPADITMEDYLAGWQEREGLTIDASEIAPNPGKRLTAKIMLNSLCKCEKSVLQYTHKNACFFRGKTLTGHPAHQHSVHQHT